MSNKKARKKLIKLYGAECFIEKLHLRKDTELRQYTGKGQYEKMKQLTYHHIREKQHGGKATVENGALLSEENHIWFNEQSKESQKQMNELFQKYKASVGCKVEFVEELDTRFNIASAIIVPVKLEKEHYNRAREKRAWQKEVKEER